MELETDALYYLFPEKEAAPYTIADELNNQIPYTDHETAFIMGSLAHVFKEFEGMQLSEAIKELIKKIEDVTELRKTISLQKQRIEDLERLLMEPTGPPPELPKKPEETSEILDILKKFLNETDWSNNGGELQKLINADPETLKNGINRMIFQTDIMQIEEQYTLSNLFPFKYTAIYTEGLKRAYGTNNLFVLADDDNTILNHSIYKTTELQYKSPITRILILLIFSLVRKENLYEFKEDHRLSLDKYKSSLKLSPEIKNKIRDNIQETNLEVSKLIDAEELKEVIQSNEWDNLQRIVVKK